MAPECAHEAGGVGPYVVGAVGTEVCVARHRQERRERALDVAGAQQPEAARVVDLVADCRICVRDHIEPFEQAVDGVEVADVGLSPRQVGERAGEQIRVRSRHTVQELDRRAGVHERAARPAQGARVPLRRLHVRLCAFHRVRGAGHRLLEQAVRVVAPATPCVHLRGLEAQPAVVGRQLDRLLEVRGGLLDRADGDRVLGRFREQARGLVVEAGQPQVARHLGRRRVDHAGELLVQLARAGVGELCDDGLTQERVAIAEAALGGQEESAVHRAHHGLRGRDRGQLAAAQLAPRDGGQLGHVARLLRQRAGGGAHDGTQARRRALEPASGGTGGLDREQRVAVGGRDDLVVRVGIQRRDLAHEVADRDARERLELGLDERVTRALGDEERVERGLRRGVPARHDDQHAFGREAPGDVREQLQALAVGEVDVVEEQRERAVGCGVLERVDRGLRQARALQLGRDRRGQRRRGTAEARRQGWHERGQVVGPVSLLRHRRHRRSEAAQQLRPETERRGAAELHRRAHRRARAGRGGVGQQLIGQPGLADPALALERDDEPFALRRALPGAAQRRELRVAPDEARLLDRRRGNDDRRRRRLVRAQLGFERAGLRRDRDAELRAQPLAKALAGRQRAGTISRGRQPLHEVARGGLVERVEREAPARVLDGVLGCGRLAGEPREHGRHPMGMLVARLEHPVLVEIREQVPPAAVGRSLEIAGRDGGVEAREVGLAAQSDPVAPPGQRPVRSGAERAPQRPGGAAQ